MSYWLGIDFGTTFTAAAVIRDGEQSVELVPLGENGTSTASVVFVAPDGSLVLGDAAVRRAVTDPDRVIREVKRRIGDQTPVLVSGEPIGAHTLAARFVRWVVDRVTEREGAPPAGIGVTYPASWGPHKRTLLSDALMFAGVGDVTLVTEPEAAAVAYTASGHVPAGSAIGVYDLGGGTFDATIVRQRDGGGFELAGRPEGIDSLGGIDFDEAVFEQVRAHLGAAWAGLDFADPLVMTAAATLRHECTEAKKALSSDTEVTIPVMLPGVSTQVRMVRSEFEQLIAPAIDATVDAMRRAIGSAGMRADELSAVLLVGGSSRIPLVAQQVGAELDLPVTVDSDPKAVVAIGAALAVSPRPESGTAATALIASRERLALPPGEEEAAAAGSARSRRKITYALVGAAACVAAMFALAGFVGSDVLPGGETPTGEGLAAPALDEDDGDGDGPGSAKSKDAVDPWTGKPYTETTAPGPTRSDAKPTKESPTKLAPKPTRAKNRDALIEGAKPPPAPSSGGDDGDDTPAPGGGDPSSEQPPPPVETTTDDPPPPAETTTEEPPPPAETTTEEPPPPVETTTEEPPPVENPGGDPPAGDPPAGDPPGEGGGA
ncbi:MAG TPA: Hsp70 family protein [Actinophytocola sp.]|jgi:actin-like ATPase involved in cell morphogenesis|nr:Hsp70 family protein [Actinophytocola sp.]